MTQVGKETKSNDASDQEISKELLEKHGQSENKPGKYRLWFSRRFLILILVFWGYFLAVALKVSINIAVIEMSTNKTISNGNQTIEKVADFQWDLKTIGLVQGSINFGLFFSAFGGYLAIKFGGSVTYGVTTAIESILTILSPLFLSWNFYAFMGCRIAVGLFDGWAYASTAEIYSRWVPEKERSTFMSFIFCGVYIAVAVSYPLFGYVAYYFGWEMIFYITGGSALLWSIIWLILIPNEPSEDKFISKKELLYILSEAETTPREQIVHPYKKIIMSPAVWALGIAKLTYSCGFFIIIGALPLYVKDALNAEVDEVGVVASIPNFVCIFVTPLIGAIMDYLQNNTSLTPNQIHKRMMTFGYITSSILFIVAAFSPNFAVAMTCFVLIKLFLSFNFLILQLICIFMAPKHSSVLLGVSTFWFVISQILIPTAIGFIVVNHSLDEWNKCFLLAAGVLLIGAVVYVIYGSSELQPWAMSSNDDTKKESLDKTDEDEK